MSSDKIKISQKEFEDIYQIEDTEEIKTEISEEKQSPEEKEQHEYDVAIGATAPPEEKTE